VSPADAPARPRLKTRYDAEVRAQLKDELHLTNIMQVPRLEKIVLNMGVGKATQQPSLLEGALRDLEQIAGQKPVVTKAKKSIAGFKLREGNSTGWSASPSPASVTSAGSTPTASTVGATTRSGSPSSSSSRRSTTTRSTPHEGWTSSSSPPPVPTPKGEPCSARSGSRSSARGNKHAMAKKALRIKQQEKPKFKVRAYTRCQRCGRPRAVFRKFGLCRICLRELTHAGEVPGVTKASW